MKFVHVDRIEVSKKPGTLWEGGIENHHLEAVLGQLGVEVPTQKNPWTFRICWCKKFLDLLRYESSRYKHGILNSNCSAVGLNGNYAVRRAGIHFLQGYLDLRTRWLAKKKVMSHLEKVKHMDKHWPLNKIKGIQYDISNQPQREIAWFFYQFTSPLAPPPIAHLLLESRLHTHTGIAKPLVENLQQSEWI